MKPDYYGVILIHIKVQTKKKDTFSNPNHKQKQQKKLIQNKTMQPQFLNWFKPQMKGS